MAFDIPDVSFMLDVDMRTHPRPPVNDDEDRLTCLTTCWGLLWDRA